MKFESEYNDDNRRFRRTLRAASRVVGVDWRDVLGGSRNRDVVIARSIIQYILYFHYLWTYADIGRAMALDHSSVISAVTRVCRGIEKQNDYAWFVPAVERSLTLEEFHPFKI